jgi:hypothetical protein
MQSKIQVTQGAGTNLATHEITESAEQRHLSRTVLNDPNGVTILPLSETDFDTKVGSLTETAPTTDTASSGLNGRLQRIAQRLTSLITALGNPFQAGGSIGNTSFGVNNIGGASAVNIQDGGNSITVDGAVTVNGVATESTLFALNNKIPTGLAITGSSLNVNVTNNTSPSTSTLQTTGNTSLNNIDTKLVSTAKGIQGGTGLTVQQLNNSGRNTRNFMLDTYTVAPAVEAVQSVVQYYNNVAVAGTTQPIVVPVGKKLRLTGYSITTKSLNTVGSVAVRVRANTAGLAVLASPLVFSMEAGSRAGATTVAMTGGLGTVTGVFPEGLEFAEGTGLAFSMAGYGPTGALLAQGVTKFQIFGYEY